MQCGTCRPSGLISLLPISVYPAPIPHCSTNPPGTFPPGACCLYLAGCLGITMPGSLLSSGHCHAKCHFFSESLLWPPNLKLLSAVKWE